MTTPEQIEKLPKWARDLIRDIEREREMAIRSLNRWKDEQTPSPFYVEDVICTGEEKGPSFKTRYIQTNSISIKHGGVRLRVMIREDSPMHTKGIDLQWTDEEEHSDDIAFIPTARQSASLIAKGNMRGKDR